MDIHLDFIEFNQALIQRNKNDYYVGITAFNSLKVNNLHNHRI